MRKMKSFVKLMLAICFCETGLLITINCEAQTLDVFTLPVKTSIRAIAVPNDTTVWFAGSNGCFGFSRDNGLHWHIDSIRINGRLPDFRMMAVINEQKVLLLNAGSPAWMLQSTDHGITWQTLFSDTSKDIFFDAMIFRDESNGIVAGDPEEGCFYLLLTDDGGVNWRKLPCNRLPKAANGEACFAASNSSLCIVKAHIWFGTGGSASRVFVSKNFGDTWEVRDAPLPAGKQLTGIFAIDFYNQKRGIIAGGDYEHKEENRNTKAITRNGGKTWKVAGNGLPPGFCSCVKYQPHSKGKVLLIGAHPGIYLSCSSGKHWELIETKDQDRDGVNFNTLAFAPSGKVAWCAGADGKVGRITMQR